MRLTLRKVLVLVVGAGLVWLNYATINYICDGALSHWLFARNKFNDNELSQSDFLVREQTHYSKYKYSGYDRFLSLFENNLDKVKATPLEQRCKVFFEDFTRSSPDWEFPRFQSPAFSKDIVNKKAFFGAKLKELKSLNGPDFEASISHNVTIDNKFNHIVRQSTSIQHGMADTMTLFRVYSKCFIQNSIPELNDIYKRLSTSFFPFLTKLIPSYTINGHTLPENSIPIFDDNNRFTEGVYTFETENNLIDFYHKNSNGRGILLSASTKHARDITKLIRVLRALNNELPIQIVSKSDLDKRVKDYIDIAATCEIDFLLDKTHGKEHEVFKPELDLLNQYKDFGAKFPKQQIVYVDISNSVKSGYKWAFTSYTNKILALLLTSFKEVIFFDADTVPLVPIEDFFESAKYKLGGAYFFQDRSIRDHNDWVETNYFASLCPTNEDSLDTLFDIPRVTEKTLNNKYMTGWRHFQEAGVIVIDRVKHFPGILATTSLVLWKEPVKASIWGDKELYWLGLSLTGDESYEFNSHAAGSVGKVTKNPKFKYYPSSQGHELCSSHPGHADENGRLLWINSGFAYCKKNGYYRDRSTYPLSLLDEAALSSLYKKPLEIDSIVIPPDLPRYREPKSPIDISQEIKFKKSWDTRKMDYDEMLEKLPKESKLTQISEWGPQKGWVKSPLCYGYQYCAYDKVTGYGTDTEDVGTYFAFDETAIKWFEFISKVWYTGNSKVRPEV